MRRAIDIDVEQASKLVEVLKEYLDTFDSRADDFDQMDDYMPYRVINCGYW